jgi:hypothetical protein
MFFLAGLLAMRSLSLFSLAIRGLQNFLTSTELT